MPTPAEMRDRYKRYVYRWRNFPGKHGLRTHRVEIGLVTWSGGRTGEGTKSAVFTEVLERDGIPPRVRWLTATELALNGLMAGTVEIGPITPDFSGGGSTPDVLRGVSLGTGDEFFFRITGPQHDSALYKITKTSFERALHYTIQAEPVSEIASLTSEDVLIDNGQVLLDNSGIPLLNA